MKKIGLILIICIVLGGFCTCRFLYDNFSIKNYDLNNSANIPPKESLKRFSDGLKIKTISNSDYNKTDFEEFNKFINYIQTAYPDVFKKCEFKLINDYAILLKLKGKTDNLPNIITAHYDVVGVKNDKNWKYSPFSGHFNNEYIYSRGTIDDKGAVFAILEALNELLKNNFIPDSDLYIAFSHCEETGSIEGAPKIIEYFKSKNIRFNSILDEGGRIVDINSKYFAFIGTSEKGRLLSKVTLYGIPSHASMPNNKTAVLKLAKLIQAFSKNDKKAFISKETEQYYKTTYKSHGLLTRFLISNIDILKPLFIYKISKNPEDNARIRTTFAITIIEASNVQNAISSDASLLIDARILPNETTQDVKNYINEKIKKILPDEDYKIEYLSQIEPSLSKEANSLEFKKLSNVINKLYPNIPISPYLTLGGTDAREYAEISDNTFRFLPCILKPQDASLMHSDNEKISIENWSRMINFYKEYMLEK